MSEWIPNAAGVHSGTPGDWQPGETVTVEADGASVPGFRASVTLPLQMTLFPGVDAPVTRSAGATVTFSPTDSHVRIQLDSEDNTHHVGCVVEGASGETTVAAAHLLRIPAGAMFVSVFATDISTVVDGSSRVDVVAGRLSSGDGLSVTFQ